MIRLPKRPTQPGEFFEWCRGIHDTLAALIPHPGTNTRRVLTPRGTFVGANPKSGTGGTASMDHYRVRLVQQNSLLCRTYSVNEAGEETIGSSDVEIAKPFDLQPASFHNQTIGLFEYEAFSNGGKYDYRQATITTARTVDIPVLPSSTEDEQYILGVSVVEHVWPEYVENSTVILAARLGTPLRGLSLMELPGQRAWRMAWYPRDVCVTNDDGTTSFKRVMIRGSLPFD